MNSTLGNGEIANEKNALWRSCADWLIRCGVLDRNHRVTWQNSTILEFGQVLRDGVLLCQAVNQLSRGCVEIHAVNLRPQLSQVIRSFQAFKFCFQFGFFVFAILIIEN